MTDRLIEDPDSAYDNLRIFRSLDRIGDSQHKSGREVEWCLQEAPDLRRNRTPGSGEDLELLRMVQLAQAHGWQKAVEAIRPQWSTYVSDPRRAAFLKLLPLTSHTVALEIGTGLGQIIQEMGNRTAVSYGLELSPAQAAFTACRCRQQGLKNVSIAAGGDDLMLPYKDRIFDVVVLSLVLEWVRLPGERSSSSGGQRQILDEIFRVLKPGGRLFLSTKNRYAIRYMLGGRDENFADMRFGNAMPRIISKLLARGKRTGLLHSYRALSAMLRAGGFELLESFWAAPDLRYPQHYIRVDNGALRIARSQPGFKHSTLRREEFLMRWVPAPWIKYLSHGLIFIAGKPENSSS